MVAIPRGERIPAPRANASNEWQDFHHYGSEYTGDHTCLAWLLAAIAINIPNSNIRDSLEGKELVETLKVGCNVASHEDDPLSDLYSLRCKIKYSGYSK